MKPDAYSGEARLGRIRDKEAVINELSYVDPMTPSLGETVKNFAINCMPADLAGMMIMFV
jgi:hypothetical protein